MKQTERTYDDRMFKETFEHGYTWLNGFLRNVVRYGSRLAIIDPANDKSWTYEELDRETNRLAHALAADGVGKNDVVTTALVNSPEFAFTYIGPRKIGAILNPANFNLAAGEFALLIDYNKPKVFIYSAPFKEVMVKALELAKHKPARVVVAEAHEGEEIPEDHVRYEDYVAGRPETTPEMPVSPHIYDEVLRLCTSGTTSLPKNVPINDINDVLSAHDVIMQYPMTCHDVTLNMTPWFHRGGCHCGGPGPAFYVGACVVVSRKFSPRTILNWTEKYGITFLMGAPATLEMLARTQVKNPVDLSSLKGLITMSAPLEKESCIRFQKELTPHIFNGYGTTETFWNSFLRPYDLPDSAGTVGGSCIDDEVRLVKLYDDRKAEPDDLAAFDNGEVGEVIIWSPAKCTYSYYNDPAETAEKFYKGWMYTGDIGVWGENRYITIYGRKDDMIITSAENIYPSQVEEILNSFDEVKDSIVCGIPDKVRGQVTAAYIIPSDESVTIEDIAKRCVESPMLSAYKRPRYYRLVDSLPHNATGKKLHNMIRERAESDRDAGLLVRPGALS